MLGVRKGRDFPIRAQVSGYWIRCRALAGRNFLTESSIHNIQIKNRRHNIKLAQNIFMKYKTIIFDFDGTIADTLPQIIKIAMKDTNMYTKTDISTIDINELKDMTITQVFKKFNISIFKIPFIVNKIRNELTKYVDEIKIFPKMKETLEQLKEKDITLGIISSNNEQNIRKFLLNNAIDDFSFIHCEMNIFGKAPVISHAIKKYSLDKKTTLYIGDEVRDIEACRKAGLDIAAVTWGFNSEKVLKKYDPQFLINSPRELFKFI